MIKIIEEEEVKLTKKVDGMTIEQLADTIKKDPDGFFNSRRQGTKEGRTRLADLYESWRINVDKSCIGGLYRILCSVECDYTLADVEGYIHRLPEDKKLHEDAGMFFTDIIRYKIDDNDTVIVNASKLKPRLSYFGAAHEKGTLIAFGELSSDTGACMY